MMFNSSGNINWRIFLLLLIITSFISPVVAVFYHGYVGLIPLIAICFIILLFSYHGRYFYISGIEALRLNKGMFVGLIWYIAGISVSYFRGADDISFLVGVLVLPIFMFTGMFLGKHNDYRSIAICLVILFAVVNCLLAGKLIGQEINARTINATSDDVYEKVGNTAFWGMIGILSPIFLANSLKKKSKVHMTILFSLLFYLIYNLLFSGYATPIALFLINIILIGVIFLFKPKRNKLSNLKAVGIFAISILIGFYIFNSILKSASNSQIEVKERFSNFFKNPEGGGYRKNQGMSRFVIMDFSWQTFRKKPIFGGGGNIRTSIHEGISGGHSSAIDNLAVLGLLGGGGALLYFIIKAFCNSVRRLRRNFNFDNISNLSVLVTFIIGGIMNPYWSGIILICFLLLTEIYIYDEQPI